MFDEMRSLCHLNHMYENILLLLDDCKALTALMVSHLQKLNYKTGKSLTIEETSIKNVECKNWRNFQNYLPCNVFILSGPGLNEEKILTISKFPDITAAHKGGTIEV